MTSLPVLEATDTINLQPGRLFVLLDEDLARQLIKNGFAALSTEHQADVTGELPPSVIPKKPPFVKAKRGAK